MTDDQFGQLVVALPALRVLSISPYGLEATTAPTATLRTLDHIARRCPGIIKVSLHLDLRQQLSIPTSELSHFPPCFESMNFGLSEADFPDEISGLLMWMFRDCRQLSISGGVEATFEGDWDRSHSSDMDRQRDCRALWQWEEICQRVQRFLSILRGVERPLKEENVVLKQRIQDIEDDRSTGGRGVGYR